MTKTHDPLAIIGTGAWGQALKTVYPHATLYGRGGNVAEDTVLMAVPAQSLADALTRASNARTVILACKGIMQDTGLLPAQVAEKICPDASCAVLSGPNFATEIARGLPAAATLACADAQLAERMNAPAFRLYWTDDIIGAQVAGALKNVLAIACGIVDGLKLGENSRAAIITRGLAEIGRLTHHLGGRRETLMGLCGVGDVILTCTSAQSRNYRFGMGLAAGIRATSDTVEGIHTAQAIARFFDDVDMPISRAVNACITGRLSGADMIDHLLSRPVRTDKEGM